MNKKTKRHTQGSQYTVISAFQCLASQDEADYQADAYNQHEKDENYYDESYVFRHGCLSAV